MTSSISNSNRRGVIAGLSVLLGVGILLGFDQYTYSEHEDLVGDAVERMTQDPPVIPIIQLTPTLETENTFNHELLEKKQKAIDHLLVAIYLDPGCQEDMEDDESFDDIMRDSKEFKRLQSLEV